MIAEVTGEQEPIEPAILRILLEQAECGEPVTLGNGPMPIYRVVLRTKGGKTEQREYPDLASLLAAHEQIGIEEDSYTMRLHGEPILKGLIGPMSDGRNVVRYESPEVFAAQTEEWAKNPRRRRGSNG